MASTQKVTNRSVSGSNFREFSERLLEETKLPSGAAKLSSGAAKLSSSLNDVEYASPINGSYVSAASDDEYESDETGDTDSIASVDAVKFQHKLADMRLDEQVHGREFSGGNKTKFSPDSKVVARESMKANTEADRLQSCPENLSVEIKHQLQEYESIMVSSAEAKKVLRLIQDDITKEMKRLEFLAKKRQELYEDVLLLQLDIQIAHDADPRSVDCGRVGVDRRSVDEMRSSSPVFSETIKQEERHIQTHTTRSDAGREINTCAKKIRGVRESQQKGVRHNIQTHTLRPNIGGINIGTEFPKDDEYCDDQAESALRARKIERLNNYQSQQYSPYATYEGHLAKEEESAGNYYVQKSPAVSARISSGAQQKKSITSLPKDTIPDQLKVSAPTSMPYRKTDIVPENSQYFSGGNHYYPNQKW